MSSTNSEQALARVTEGEAILVERTEDPPDPGSPQVRAAKVRVLNVLLAHRRRDPDGYVAMESLVAPPEAIADEPPHLTVYVVAALIDTTVNGKPAVEAVQNHHTNAVAVRLCPETPDGLFEDLAASLAADTPNGQADAAPSTVSPARAREGVVAYLAYREAEARAKDAKRAWDRIRSQLGEEFTLAQCEGIVVNGYQLWLDKHAGHVETPQGKDAAIAALQSGPHAPLVKLDFNYNSLAAVCREMERGEVPRQAWEGVIEYKLEPQVGVRKAK